MPTPKTTAHQLLELKIGGDLADYVRPRRQAGDSWENIAHEIAQQTGTLVTSASIRNWMAGEPDMDRTLKSAAKVSG